MREGARFLRRRTFVFLRPGAECVTAARVVGGFDRLAHEAAPVVVGGGGGEEEEEKEREGAGRYHRCVQAVGLRS